MTLETWTDLLSQVGPAHHARLRRHRWRRPGLAHLVCRLAARTFAGATPEVDESRLAVLLAEAAEAHKTSGSTRGLAGLLRPLRDRATRGLRRPSPGARRPRGRDRSRNRLGAGRLGDRRSRSGRGGPGRAASARSVRKVRKLPRGVPAAGINSPGTVPVASNCCCRSST